MRLLTGNGLVSVGTGSREEPDRPISNFEFRISLRGVGGDSTSLVVGVDGWRILLICTPHFPSVPNRLRYIQPPRRGNSHPLLLCIPTKMVSLLSHVNPTPSFPSYTGPYSVGSYAVEIPITELPSNATHPDPSVTTLSFRVFYPCEAPSKPPHPVYWIPEPQKEYLRAYAGFCGASPRLSKVIQSVPGRYPEWSRSRLTLCADICPSSASYHTSPSLLSAMPGCYRHPQRLDDGR